MNNDRAALARVWPRMFATVGELLPLRWKRAAMTDFDRHMKELEQIDIENLKSRYPDPPEKSEPPVWQ